MCIKTIGKPEAIKRYTQAHHPRYKLGYYAIDTIGRIVPEWESKELTKYTALRINHYFTKSKEQWIKRRAMGKADLGTENKRTLEEFYKHDNNDEKDLHAFLYANDIKQMLKDYGYKL